MKINTVGNNTFKNFTIASVILHELFWLNCENMHCHKTFFAQALTCTLAYLHLVWELVVVTGFSNFNFIRANINSTEYQFVLLYLGTIFGAKVRNHFNIFHNWHCNNDEKLLPAKLGTKKTNVLFGKGILFICVFSAFLLRNTWCVNFADLSSK